MDPADGYGESSLGGCRGAYAAGPGVGPWREYSVVGEVDRDCFRRVGPLDNGVEELMVTVGARMLTTGGEQCARRYCWT